MNKIVCPIDFTEASLTAVEFATKIAENHASSLLLIHVITSEEYNDKLKENREEALAEINQEIGSKLELLTEQVNKNSKADYDICSYGILYGELTDQITEISIKENMAMVVMGTNGASDINEARMGSNTVKVINHSKIPVLSVPARATYKGFSRIVYGSELSDEDKSFLRQVINFAVPFDSRIYLVHVSDSDGKKNREYNEYLQDIKTYFNYKKLNIEQFVTSEEVAIALEHTLNVHDANLLVLVHKSRKLLESLFHRSLTKKMSYLTNFPLLALRN